jgi:hypothetical protein
MISPADAVDGGGDRNNEPLFLKVTNGYPGPFEVLHIEAENWAIKVNGPVEEGMHVGLCGTAIFLSATSVQLCRV